MENKYRKPIPPHEGGHGDSGVVLSYPIPQMTKDNMHGLCRGCILPCKQRDVTGLYLFECEIRREHE